MPNPDNPQDINHYTYVQNNPLNYVDPSGHYYCASALECDLSDADIAYEKERVIRLGKKLTISHVSRKFDVTFTGEWSLEDQYLYAKGVIDFGIWLKEKTGYDSASEASVYVFRPIEFRWMGGVCKINGETCGADAYLGPNVIRVWAKYFKYEDVNGKRVKIIIDNPHRSTEAVHEMSHIFDVLTDGAFSDFLYNSGIKTREGFSLKESDVKSSNEVAADYLLNSVYGSFIGDKAEALSTALDDEWDRLIDLAHNYGN